MAVERHAVGQRHADHHWPDGRPARRSDADLREDRLQMAPLHQERVADREEWVIPTEANITHTVFSVHCSLVGNSTLKITIGAEKIKHKNDEICTWWPVMSVVLYMLRLLSYYSFYMVLCWQAVMMPMNRDQS